MTDELLFPDPQQFDLERAKLARRRKIAESLIATQADRPRMMGSWVLNTGPAGSVAASIARGLGQHEQGQIDAQDKLLHANENRVAKQLMDAIPAEQGPERQTAQLRAMKMPSLRDSIKLQFGFDEAEANRIERGEQLAADRQLKVEEAEANRIEKGEQLAADRVAREDLRQMPTIHISNSGGGGGRGKAPSGYRYNEDGTALEPIPGGPHDKRPGSKPLTPKQMETQRAYTDLEKSLNEYDKLLEGYDPQSKGALDPTLRAPLESAHTDVMMKLKDLYQMGAPQQGDLMMLERGLDSPVTIKGTLKSAAFGAQPFKEKSKQLRTLLNNSRESFDAQFKVESPRHNPPEPKPKTIVVKSQDEWEALEPGTAYMTPDGKKGVR